MATLHFSFLACPHGFLGTPHKSAQAAAENIPIPTSLLPLLPPGWAEAKTQTDKHRCGTESEHWFIYGTEWRQDSDITLTNLSSRKPSLHSFHPTPWTKPNDQRERERESSLLAIQLGICFLFHILSHKVSNGFSWPTFSSFMTSVIHLQ